MIKDNLILLRKLNDYSQEEIAEKIGISRQAYGKWEKGKTVPDIEKCALLADIYGVTVDNLIHTERIDNSVKLPPILKGKHIFGTVAISERGQIVISKHAREIFDIKGGDRLILLGDEAEGLSLVKKEVFMERMDMAVKFASNHLSKYNSQ